MPSKKKNVKGGKAATKASTSTSKRRRLNVFISHRFEDKELAEKVRDKLMILSKGRLDIHTYIDTPGSVDWQDWVEEHIAISDFLVLLYTNEREDWKWCLYEVGLFAGRRRGAQICIKHYEIADPPGPIRKLQPYDSNTKGIRSFLREFLYETNITGKKRPINSRLLTMFETETNKAVEEISELFDKANVSIEYFAKRISIGPMKLTQGGRRLSFSGVKVKGKYEARSFLGLSGRGGVKWATFVKAMIAQGNNLWVEELQKIGREVVSGDLQERVLSSHKGPSGSLYLPVISRVERIGRTHARFFLIFVRVEEGYEGADYDAGLERVPDTHAAMIRMLNMTRRLRWDILEPAIEALGRRYRSDKEHSTTMNALMEEIASIETEAEATALSIPSVVKAAFPDKYHPGIDKMFNEYNEARAALTMATETEDKEMTLKALDDILRVNKQFLIAGGSVYLEFIHKLSPTDEHRPIVLGLRGQYRNDR